ncbi:MAG: hypothetical protein JWP63_2886 [Candidatus Solibacter sp.]|nr:hypothetical protein [Candidatus Solibacter sp.]
MVGIVLIYDGAIFYSRWSQTREGQREEARLQAEQARKTLEMMGSDALRITSFYASPGEIPRGGHANLCYGVNGAKQVRLDPPEAAVWPSQTRCVQVTPHADTTYKLTAEDAGGHAVSQTFRLKVTR